MNLSEIGAPAAELGRSRFTAEVDKAKVAAEAMPANERRTAVLDVLERCRGHVELLIFAGEADGMTFGLRSVLARYAPKEDAASQPALETPVSDRVLAEFDALVDEGIAMLREGITMETITVVMQLAMVKMQARLVVRYAQLGGTTRGLIAGDPMMIIARAIEEKLRGNTHDESK